MTITDSPGTLRRRPAGAPYPRLHLHPRRRRLFGKPTAINNVETLLCVPEILRIGGPAFAAIGTDSSTGTRRAG
jgi:NADH:ubiquinone oxidoreductase subunit F (NADH-binding)